MDGGLELFQAGTRGLKREFIIRLETSALTPEKGEIIHYYAVNRWDEEDEFDEFAKPSVALSPEAERILGVTNERLANCRPSNVVLPEFLAFIDGAKLIAHNLEFDLGFLNNA
jgi:DNA polymerase III alpha subunit (gram-positive type)